MSAEYQVSGAIAVITLNNPPVNGMGLATRTAIMAGLERALADVAVSAIVLTGAGKAFSGGADIKEFNSPLALAAPSLHTLIATVERSAKPVLAAIHSVCIGGGLELALGCHYRITAPGAQIALPEVKLGLVPGAGGTQRLPRAVGLARALDMIVSGAPVRSEQLADTALFDRVLAPGEDLLAAAIAFAASVADVRPLPMVRERLPQYDGDAGALLAGARTRLRSTAPGYPAPLRCVDALAAAVAMPFDEGLKFELAIFMELIRSPESLALRHAFFAERGAGKVAGVGPDTPPRPIRRAAVVGAGTMGRGIAMTFANAGIPVTLLETAAPALAHGQAAIRALYQSTLDKGKLTPQAFEQRLALIEGTLVPEDIAGADIVIEAVFEDMAVKQALFARLDGLMQPGAILASNTSTLDLNRLAAATARPQDVVGLHFFSPANVMKLLEIVRGSATANDVLATALVLAKKLNKTAVVAGVCDGFIGNRMIEQYSRQAGFLLEEGGLPQQIDRAIEAFGFAMGPFRMIDMAGNDIAQAIRQRRQVERPDFRYSKTADLLCGLGRYGQKCGAGWYDYRAGERQPYPSDIVNQMIVQHSADLGLERRVIGDEEIVERLVYALVNEGALILEQGIAQRAADIDVVYLSGYGFPAYRGGPMFYADTVGLDRVLDSINRYAAGRHGEAWAAAPLLRALAKAGKTFN